MRCTMRQCVSYAYTYTDQPTIVHSDISLSIQWFCKRHSLSAYAPETPYPVVLLSLIYTKVHEVFYRVICSIKYKSFKSFLLWWRFAINDFSLPNRCGTYPNLPPQCYLQRDPKDYCCYVPVCDWNKPTPNPYITPSPQPTAAPQPGISTIAPSLGSSQTPAPKLG